MPDVQVPTREKLGQHASYMQGHPLQTKKKQRRQMTIKKTKKSHTRIPMRKEASLQRRAATKSQDLLRSQKEAPSA